MSGDTAGAGEREAAVSANLEIPATVGMRRDRERLQARQYERLIASRLDYLEGSMLPVARWYAEDVPALVAAVREAEARAERAEKALRHFKECADTPLMRDVLAERDEAVARAERAERERDEALTDAVDWKAAADAYLSDIGELARASADVVRTASWGGTDR